MGRTRTLLGTRMIPLRISVQLIKELDELAESESTSRNTLMGRVLATYALAHKKNADGVASQQRQNQQRDD